jgi:hypothetical protein
MFLSGNVDAFVRSEEEQEDTNIGEGEVAVAVAVAVPDSVVGSKRKCY